MYKVFVNNKPIILTSHYPQDKQFKTYPLKYVDLPGVIRDLRKTDKKDILLYHKNADKLLSKFLKKLPNVIAGGGKVFNSEGKVLFIHRNDKWDLPKGKVEAQESLENGALREVEEETGVSGLSINKSLQTTYHIFKRNGRYKIKITYWFEMQTQYTGLLVPQINEGITKVKWLGKKNRLKP